MRQVYLFEKYGSAAFAVADRELADRIGEAYGYGARYKVVPLCVGAVGLDEWEPEDKGGDDAVEL